MGLQTTLIGSFLSVEGKFRLAGDVVEEVFAGHLRGRGGVGAGAGAKWRGRSLGEEDAGNEEDHGGEEERPEVGENGKERRCDDGERVEDGGESESGEYVVLELEELLWDLHGFG